MGTIRNLGFGFLGRHTAKQTIELVQRAEALGFSSAWVAEDYFYGGAFATVSACAAATTNIQLGIGVINPYTRHPVLSAMEAAALDSLCGGRLMLAMGASNKRWMEQQMGIPYRKPLTATCEAVDIIKTLLRDGQIDYSGELFQAGPLELSFEPLRRDMPVYMGVKGDRALYMAGQKADGVLLSVGCTLEYIQHVRERITAGANSVGRDPSEIHIAAYLPTCICDSSAEAVERMRSEARRCIGMHGAQPILTCGGFAPEQVQPFRDAVMEGKVCDLPVTDEMVRKVVIAGTPDECRERIEAYVAAGVEMPICFELSCDTDAVSTLENLSRYLLQ
ncbi:MAG: LLM class flavin-dependent oxidoreductase [Clostridiales bacterium]|nr:LLM class flavin-dependent oxidoreductase [Clostridiales bacterium]